MPWKEIRIIMREKYADYPHNVLLCYESERDYIDNFRSRIEKAEEMNNGDVVVINAPQGAIEAMRHFSSDYRESKTFEITIGNRIKINKAYFTFEKDNDAKAKYDDMFIKNIIIKFKNSDCELIEE